MLCILPGVVCVFESMGRGGVGGLCCILRQIFTHFVCKSLDQAAQQYGRGRFHSTSSQLPELRDCMGISPIHIG